MGKHRARKRLRRSHLKIFSSGYINVGRGPNPIVLAEYKDRARHVDIALEKLFGLGHVKENKPRLEALLKAEQMKGAVPISNHVSIHNGKMTKLLLFYSKQSCFFIENFVVLGRLRRSIHYANREEALERYHKRKIIWVETVSYIPADSAI